jgi:hypothetical protein
MLNFDSALSDSLKLGNTTSFWVLKLYYNDDTDATNYIGVSEIDRLDGSDFYHGIVSSWGSYQQSLDFFNFSTRTGNMSVKLINVDRSILGGRFSDLFSTKNFANRKWELFQNTSQTSTYDTSARMIAQGVIAGDISYNVKNVGFTLLDLSEKHHKQLPTSIVDSDTYPNAPEKNINKPIPMTYGDFHDQTGIGTIPTSGGQFDRYFTKSHFPAIVTDEWSSSDQNVQAKPDSVAIHRLDSKNIYTYSDDYFSACSDANTTENESTPLITYKGGVWRAYIQLFDYDGYDFPNVIDGKFNTNETLSSSEGYYDYIYLGIPKIPKLGTLIDIKAMLSYGNFNGSSNIWTIGTSTNLTWGNDNSSESVSLLAEYTSDQEESWDFEGSTFIALQDNVGTSDVEINQVGIEISFKPDKMVMKKIKEQYEIPLSSVFAGGIPLDASEGLPRIVLKTRTRTLTYPSEIDVIYFSGTGRKYGSWINSRSGTYSDSDYIENPIYIIEDMIRTELGLTSLDTDMFDDSGDYNNGHIGDIYDDAVRDIKFAMSQYKFINSKDFIEKLGQQCFSWVYLSGDGNFKIRTLRRSGDYSSADKTIDFSIINLDNISRTQLGAVRNDITINYNYNYGQDQNLSHINTSDGTSQGTGVGGIQEEFKLELDADSIIDETTATQLADAYLTILKDRKEIIDFTCLTPRYNDLEIGDIINFSNWDSNISIYGSAMGGYWMITEISKSIKSTKIKVIKVST